MMMIREMYYVLFILANDSCYRTVKVGFGLGVGAGHDNHLTM